MSIASPINHYPRPPLAQGLPLFGNALAMRHDLVTFLVGQYRQLGPVFRIRALNQEFVVLAGPEANTFVTQQRDDTFRSHELWHGFGCEFHAPHHLSAIDGEPHAQMRKLFKPAYSVTRLLADIALLVDIEKNVLNGFQIGQKVPALYLFRLIVTQQLGKALANAVPAEHLPHIITAIRIALNVYVSKSMPPFMLMLPSYRRARQQFLHFGQELLATHRATTREKNDLIDDILLASHQPDFQQTLSSEEQMAFAALGPFVAGLDTAANECTFLLYELFKHPDILAQCIAEADDLFSDGLPNQEQIRGHGVLHAAMMETLRLHSIAPVINRTAARDFVFAGHQIKEGENVIIATTVSHFLPELFPSPYTFDIERYSEKRREHKQKGAYAPFGLGTHLCLGAGAAEAQIVLVLATLLHQVRVEHISPQSRMQVKNNPTPTFGYAFRISFSERRHE